MKVLTHHIENWNMNRLIAKLSFATVLLLSGAYALATEVTVYKSPTCGCCKKWVEHMQANGFSVKAIDTDDIVKYKTANGVPYELGSCHTALVDGYVIEGHVPASDIKRLLKERPPVRGLAVPGMPSGSPGMEQGTHKDKYDVMSFDKQGKTAVYAKH